MRWLKFILYAVSALLLLAVASTVVVIILFDDDKIRDTLISSVEENTDARLSIAGDFSVKLSINPTISVTDLALRSTSDAYAVEAGELTVQVSLLSLLSGPVRIRELRLNDVWATVKYGDKTKTAVAPSLEQLDLDELLPVIDRLGLGNFSFRLVNREDGSEQHIRFDKLDLARSGTSRFLMLRGTGEVAGQAYKLAGKLGLLRDMVSSNSPFPLELQVTGKEYSLSIEGAIDKPLQGQGIDLTVLGNVKELTDLIDYNRGKAVSLGQLKSSMRVKGDIPDIRLEDVKLSLKRGGDINLELQNNTINPYTWGVTGIQVKGYVKDPHVFDWLVPVKLPAFQQTVLNATLFQKDHNYTIEDIHIQATAPDIAELELNGKITLGGTAETWPVSYMDLALRFSSTKTETIKPFVFDELPEIGQTRGTLRLLLKSGALSVENLEVDAGSENTLHVNATGKISDIPLSDKPASETVDLKLIVRAASTKKLEPVFKLSLPEVQDIYFEGHLTGSSEDWELGKIDLRAGKTSKVAIKAQGTIHFGHTAGIAVGASGEKAVNLDVQLETLASQSLSHWARQQIPALGPVRAKVHVSGSLDQVLLHKANIKISNNKGVKLVARGQIGIVDLKQGAKLHSTDLRLQLDAPSLASLPGIASYKIPSLGKVSGSAQIVNQGDSYKLDKIAMIAGDKNKPALRITGQILDPISLLGVKLRLDVDADMYDLLTVYFKPGLQDLGRIKGKLDLSDADGSLGVYKMNIVAEKKKAYRVILSGDIGNILKRGERDADIELFVEDWKFVEKLLDRPLPAFAPAHSEGKLFAKRNESRFDGKLSIGDTVVLTKLSINYANKLPRLSGSIVAPFINLLDIGVKPKTVDDLKVRKTDKQDNNGLIFTTEPIPLQALRQINGEIQIKVDEIRGIKLIHDSLDMKLSLSDGRLRIFPARFSFGEGAIETDFSIDASKIPVSYKLNVVAKDVDLETIALQFQRPPVAVKGAMNVIVDLTATGDSARAIASSLDGKIGLAGENTSLLKSYAELLMNNLLSWTFSSIGVSEKYLVADCGIIQLTAKQGQINSDLIIVDGPNMSLVSTLSLDLRDETIDMVLNPIKKSRMFSNVTPVQIKGSLRDPQIEAMSAKDVATRFGGLVFVPQIIIPLKALGLLGGKTTDGRGTERSPCQDIGNTQDTKK